MNLVHANTHVIKPDSGDRRFLFIQCNNKYSNASCQKGKISEQEKTDFNNCLLGCQSMEFAYRLYCQHMQFKIDIDLSLAPVTELTQTLQESNRNSIEAFLEDVHYGKHIPTAGVINEKPLEGDQ